MRVEVTGLKYGLGKCAHSCLLVDSKMFIFGGYGDGSYTNSDMYVLELDQIKSRKFIKESTNGIGPMNKNKLNSMDIITANKDHFLIEGIFAY